MALESLQEQVSEYMNKNPAHKPRRVAKTFPDTKFTVLCNAMYRWRKKYKELLEEKQNHSIKKAHKKQKLSKKKQKPSDITLDSYAMNPKKIDIWSLPDQELKDLFRVFVGYVDAAGVIHKGEALPEPIDEITNEYVGITGYQVDSILTYRDEDNILNIWFRGAGKTWKSSWILEFCMKYTAEKYLYFSLTDIAYIIADWVYIWAARQNAIIDSETKKVYGKISGRKASYQKFGLINGARYEIHGIRSSSTLGYHGWVIIFDDIIDEQHRRLPHLQLALQNKWNSQYAKIRRKKLIIDNTRKFAGDFFDFIIDQFEKKGKRYKNRKGKIANKYTLTIDLKSPYVDLCYKGDIEGYRTFASAVENNTFKYDATQIIAPWYTPEDFEVMKLEDIESFYAEILGIPMKVMGGMVEPHDIFYVNRPLHREGIQMCGIGVDCAETDNIENDMQAVVSCIMTSELIEKKQYKKFTFCKSHVKHMPIRNIKLNNPDDFRFDFVSEGGYKVRRGLIETVQLHVEFHKRYYPETTLIIAVERGGGGITVIDQVQRAYGEKVEINTGMWVELDWFDYIVKDPKQATKRKSIQKDNIRLGITHREDKTTRVFGELQYSIKIHETRFTYDQEDTVFLAQTLAFPKGKHDDGPDAGGMIKNELSGRYNRDDLSERQKALLKHFKDMKRKAYEDAWHDTMVEPWNSGGGSRRTDLGGLFD